MVELDGLKINQCTCIYVASVPVRSSSVGCYHLDRMHAKLQQITGNGTDGRGICGSRSLHHYAITS